MCFVFLHRQAVLAMDVKAEWLFDAGQAVCDNVGNSLPEGCTCTTLENDGFQINAADYKVKGQPTNLIVDFYMCEDPPKMIVKGVTDRATVCCLFAGTVLPPVLSLCLSFSLSLSLSLSLSPSPSVSFSLFPPLSPHTLD